MAQTRLPRPARLAVLACALLAPVAANAAELKLRALLSGSNVVSATESPAVGEARVMLADDNGVRVDLVYSELEEKAIGAELRIGKANENGSVIEKLDLDVDESDGRVVGALFDTSPEEAARIRAGEAYLVITTIEHPNGVIRGQLVPQPVRLPEPPPELPLADD
ncbi:CHRD domain-containing protein [Lysobacter koreensis]|uniref:CHRD domain-containing protein n=1 Tax=Lysobacter koreensis TaxID=266122 RepID=A0ABW2YS17_9GAMM